MPTPATSIAGPGPGKAIQAARLTKCFGQFSAVEDVSLEVDRGQIFGLLGPNAAGKTTLIRMLCGILAPTSGEIRIDEQAVADARPRFGYVAQRFSQYEDLSVRENLEFYAEIYSVDDSARLDQLLRRYDLERFTSRLAGNLSGGYQRRLALACALAHDPAVLFLDEPTAGIDPVTRKLLWDDFYRLASEGKSLFVTTHYMEEAERCHRLAFLSAGRLVAEGTPQNIAAALGDAVTYRAKIGYYPAVNARLDALTGVRLINQFGDQLRIVCDTATISRAQLEREIVAAGGPAVELETARPNLEDVFIALTRAPPP